MLQFFSFHRTRNVQYKQNMFRVNFKIVGGRKEMNKPTVDNLNNVQLKVKKNTVRSKHGCVSQKGWLSGVPVNRGHWSLHSALLYVTPYESLSCIHQTTLQSVLYTVTRTCFNLNFVVFVSSSSSFLYVI